MLGGSSIWAFTRTLSGVNWCRVIDRNCSAIFCSRTYDAHDRILGLRTCLKQNQQPSYLYNPDLSKRLNLNAQRPKSFKTTAGVTQDFPFFFPSLRVTLLGLKAAQNETQQPSCQPSSSPFAGKKKNYNMKCSVSILTFFSPPLCQKVGVSRPLSHLSESFSFPVRVRHALGSRG